MPLLCTNQRIPLVEPFAEIEGLPMRQFVPKNPWAVGEVESKPFVKVYCKTSQGKLRLAGELWPSSIR